MDTTEAVQYWKASANDAFDTSDKLFESKKFDHSLFFVHLSIEKILKALYIQIKQESPIFIHDLVRLTESCELTITEEQKLQLAEISTFNVSARYDDYKLKFYKKATDSYSDQWRNIGKELFNYFSSKLV